MALYSHKNNQITGSQNVQCEDCFNSQTCSHTLGQWTAV